jgi:pimeloyl-ACP methyl ester carboxylesterase
MQWASVAEEVLDLLQISECSVMAHSAGTPYALSFANKLPERIRGNICLLAPWVGGSDNSTEILLSFFSKHSEASTY